MLPSQGPISAFAFLNPLQGMEDTPFDDALRTVRDIYGCEPYLEESRYRAKVDRGRILVDDLREVLAADLGDTAEESIARLCTRRELRLNMLLHPLNSGDEHELSWVIAESDALQRFRTEISHETRETLITETKNWILDELRQRAAGGGLENQRIQTAFEELADILPLRSIERWNGAQWEQMCLHLLWSFARQGVETTAPCPDPTASLIRHRDLIWKAYHSDPDQWVNDILVSFCAAWLDQGYAHWKLPNREQGFWNSFSALYTHGSTVGKPWIRTLNGELERIRTQGLSPTEVITESLDALGVPADEHFRYLRSTMLALRGWAGMIWQTETRADRVYIGSPSGTLIEFVAVRLLLDRLAANYFHTGQPELRDVAFADLRSVLKTALDQQCRACIDQHAYIVFQLAQILGWSPQSLAQLTAEQWKLLSGELVQFNSHEQRRVFHLAFERRMAQQALDTIAFRASRERLAPSKPQLQVVCCIDAREESFRRHLEEVAPDVETFGTAGFFGVPMYYRGAADAHYAALCPIVIKPQHWVVEDVVYSLEDSHRARTKARRVIGAASHSFHVGTRSSIGGALLSTVLGPLATAPLVSRILFPQLAARMHKTARQFVAPPAVTRLRLERSENETPGTDEDQIGFTLAEMCTMAERALRDIGLTHSFARLVIFLGHGSSCMNNPHESAYHCGACSGSPGGPNARALAAMLNDVRVRRILKERGLSIPEETHFIGGLHNTATEEITFYDLELLPTNQVRSLRLARELFSRVAERNAHERCRRFESARLDLNPSEALRHVQNRAEDLAQTRPEYGNSTNAMCFVGRRSRIRGLFLDRRSFMMSYDATQDDQNSTILARILGAVIPVCEGINMLYTLSAIDTPGWGCGTKLPHNVTSLLGVMDGAASDLRPGLPLQGVDIHEPVRLMFVIESTPDALLKIMSDNPVVGRICKNGWAQLAVLDPQTARIQVFRNGRFEAYQPKEPELPQAESSLDWYRGKRDHLGFAQIGSPSGLSEC
ncbi:MAG: DUF2309 domain-containing protein [Planctomyces sp.]|nr:DUF2309 domain-containing protein [Planctomyces sp.]